MPHKCEECGGTGLRPYPSGKWEVNELCVTVTDIPQPCSGCHGNGYKIAPKYQ
jgi:DnaJ-class molecular chaperone